MACQKIIQKFSENQLLSFKNILKMSDTPYADARSESYFHITPEKLTSDAMEAVHTYLGDGIDSINFYIDQNTSLSEQAKNQFISQLRIEIAKAANENSRIFQLYIARNVFKIPAQIDISEALAKMKRNHRSENESVEEIEENQLDNDIQEVNNELDSLYKQIQEEKNKYMAIRAEYISNLQTLQALNELKPHYQKFAEIQSLMKKLSPCHLGQIKSRFEALISQANKIAEQQIRNQNLEFFKESFQFPDAPN